MSSWHSRDDDDEEDEESSGPDEGDYADVFVKAGFKYRDDGRLTWKGLCYPEVTIEFLPDGWGRKMADVWVTATFIAEPYEGAHGFKSKVVEDVTLSSLSEAREQAKTWADESREIVAKMAVIRSNFRVVIKGSLRTVKAIWGYSDGSQGAAPLEIEGLKKRFAYCQVDLPR
jgi:hypothetical protein